MPRDLTIRIDGMPVVVPPGTTVACALARAGIWTCRRSVTDRPRGPMCGMGVCFECRVTIDGRPHCRSCTVLCRDGMEVLTHG